MQRDGKNVYIFPVSINYDRLFEIRNIADMMVSKNQSNLNVLDIKKKLDGLKNHKLGRAYVLFGQTISLNDYFNNSESGLLSPKNINKAALSLTQKLKVEDHLASPVLLNMVVSTLLLYCNEEVYRLDKLVADCQSFYRYF